MNKSNVNDNKHTISSLGEISIIWSLMRVENMLKSHNRIPLKAVIIAVELKNILMKFSYHMARGIVDAWWKSSLCVWVNTRELFLLSLHPSWDLEWTIFTGRWFKRHDASRALIIIVNVGEWHCFHLSLSHSHRKSRSKPHFVIHCNE